MRARLEAILRDIGPAAVAVSGGIDSITLASVAWLCLPDSVVFHAVSPAVPPRATRRVRRLASERGWTLRIFDAGEFANPQYRANPVDRCFFCKSDLYGAIGGQTELAILSGTNLDDLSDFRPGLRAAERHGVRHPFVEAGIDKAGVRALARQVGLGALADLPAAPCLASRVTTGLHIEPAQMEAIDRTEEALREAYPGVTLRCRQTPKGYQIEIGAGSLAGIDPETVLSKARTILGPECRLLPVATYTRGSAFVGRPE